MFFEFSMSDETSDATETLVAHARGDGNAAPELLPLIYSELRALANHPMRGERSGRTLQPTALVHEAYVRLIDLLALHDALDKLGRERG